MNILFVEEPTSDSKYIHRAAQSSTHSWVLRKRIKHKKNLCWSSIGLSINLGALILSISPQGTEKNNNS